MGFLKFIIDLAGFAALVYFVWLAISHGFVTIKGERGYSADRTEFDISKARWPLAALGVGAFILATIISSSFGQIPAGARGVVLAYGAPTGQVKNPGLYMVTPFVSSIAVMNVQTQAYPVKASAASRDLQEVSTEITLNFHPNPGKVVDIYSQLRNDYTDRIVAPAVQEALKASTAQYTAQELITRRYQVQNDFRNKLESRMNQFGLNIDAISMTDFKFSDQFNQAIEAKVTQEQSALQARAKLDQVRYEAQQTVTKAQAEAQALRAQRSAITPELIHLREVEVESKAVDKWNGQLPTFSGGGTMPFIGDVSKLSKSSSQ